MRAVDYRSNAVKSGDTVLPVVIDEPRMEPAQFAADLLALGSSPSRVARLMPRYRQARRELVTDLPKRVRENLN